MPVAFLLVGAFVALFVVAPALAIAGLVVLASAALFAGQRVPDARLAVSENVIRQIDRSGRELARIDLDRPWSIRYLERNTPTAIFRIEQEDRRIDFSSDTREGEDLCRLLGVDPRPGPWQGGHL